MMSPIKILCLLCIPFLAQAQDAAEKIQQVENGLTGWIAFENAPPSVWKLEERMKAYNVRGVSIAVIRNNKLEWAKGYGYADEAEKRPVTPQTLFQAASISKSLNGVALLKLVEQGRIRLDEDINQYLKTWHPSADSGKITVAHLLSHTAGLTIHGFPGYEVTDTLPAVEQILSGQKPANTKEVKPAFAPGKRMQYSGGGTTVSQLILTSVTGLPYDQYLQKEVLDPMGMTGSFFTQPAPENKKHLLATAYDGNGKPVPGKYHVYPEMGAAGLWTNPTDLARYIIETQLSYAGKSSKVLSQAMTKTRLTPFMNKNSALGVFISDNKKYFNHNGGNAGFISQYYGGIEDGSGFVIMVNSENFGIIDEIARSIGRTYGWNDFYKPVMKKMVEVPADSLQRYAGVYKSDGIKLEIKRQDGRLYIIQDDGVPMQMYFTSPADFVVMEVRGDLQFEAAAGGYDLIVKQGGYVGRFKRQEN